MAKITRDAGFRNTIFVLPNCFEVGDFFREENFEVFEYPAIVPSFRHNRKYYSDSRILTCKLSEIKPDLLHCADYGGAMRVSLAALLSSRPIISHVRSRHDFISRRDRLFLATVKHWIFVSHDARANFGVKVKDKNAAVIYDGIKVRNFDETEKRESRADVFAEFNLAPNTKIIGIVARVAPEKDFFTLARAIKQISEKDDSIKVLIVGSTSREEANERHFREVSQFLNELNIAEYFIFTDFRTDITRFLRAFDIFVLPTHVEGFPLVILEAMAQKIPVVATEVGGVPESIKDGESGLLHEHENSVELARKIESLLNNAQFAKKIGESGFQSVKENFSRQKFAENIIGFYRQVLNLN
jgi:glycosyltransferase involved in cell wall biosynthesis